MRRKCFLPHLDLNHGPLEPKASVHPMSYTVTWQLLIYRVSCEGMPNVFYDIMTTVSYNLNVSGIPLFGFPMFYCHSLYLASDPVPGFHGPLPVVCLSRVLVDIVAPNQSRRRRASDDNRRYRFRASDIGGQFFRTRSCSS